MYVNEGQRERERDDDDEEEEEDKGEIEYQNKQTQCRLASFKLTMATYNKKDTRIITECCTINKRLEFTGTNMCMYTACSLHGSYVIHEQIASGSVLIVKYA